MMVLVCNEEENIVQKGENAFCFTLNIFQRPSSSGMLKNRIASITKGYESNL